MFRSPPSAHQALHGQRPPAASPQTQPRARATGGQGSSRAAEPGSDGFPASSTAKKAAKDVSHVPCRFFRSGQCSAGSSCVFAHIVAEPGQQKQVCGYFLKGSCKFGHKCALAHIRPGEPMSMDRKNKKAAQLEAQAAARAINGHPGEGSSAAGGAAASIAGNGVHGLGPNSSSSAGEVGRYSNGQQQQQFSQYQQQQPAAQSADQARTGQIYQQPDSSLLTLASLSNQTLPPTPGSSVPLPYQQPPGTIGTPRAPLSGLDLLNAALSQATLGGSGITPSPPTPAHHLPSQSQMPSTRMSLGLHPSPTPPHRPPFPGSASHSGTGLFQSSHQASHLIASSGASSVGGGGGSGGSPFSTSPFATPGSRALFLSSSYDAYAQERDGAYPSSLPVSTLRSAGVSRGLPRHAVSARTRSFLDSSTTQDGPDGNDSSADEAFNGDGTNSDDGEEFLPSSLSELLTEHEMERRMTRRNSNQPQLHRPTLGTHAHSQQALHHAGLHSTSAAAAFPINRLYSDTGIYTRARESSPAGPWIESVPVHPVSAGGRPADDLERTVGRRHSDRPPLGGVFDSLGGDGLSRSPAAPPAIYDSTRTLRPTALGSGGSRNDDGLSADAFHNPSAAPTSSQPTRSNLAALWDRSADASYSAVPAPVTQTRHGFPLSSSQFAGPPGQPSHRHLLGTTHQPSHLRQLPTAQLTSPSRGGGITPLMSPSSRALASHAPGMSLPGGLGVTLSRLHYQPAGTPGEGTSYSSNGLPDLAGLAYGNVSSRHPEVEGAAGTPDPWRTLDGDGYPTLGGPPPTIHQPTPIKSGVTIANRADEDDEFADDVLFD